MNASGIQCSFRSGLLKFWYVAVVQSLSWVKLFVTPWTAACQASLSFTISQSLLKLMSIESVIPYNNIILCHPLCSCPESYIASGSFPVSWLFTSGGQSIGVSVSASVLLVNIQGWFPLGLTGLISPQSKEHSRVFSSTTIWNHQFFGTQPSLWSSFHIHMTTGKPIALTIGLLLAKWCLCLIYVIYLNIHKNYWRSC